jgi:4-hydroxy-3-methylbut-2-enyl diphosphate reductase
MAISLHDLTVITATALETRAVAHVLPSVHIVEAGIALCKLDRADLSGVVVTCGVAGGLGASASTGTVVVPERVSTTDGRECTCDRELRAALLDVARRLQLTVDEGPLLTSPTLVTGSARATWSARGYVAADMETGFLRASRLAAVRVILDTPQRELSELWLHPASVLAHPSVWPQALWLGREGPRCARLAASVLAAALRPG